MKKFFSLVGVILSSMLLFTNVHALSFVEADETVNEVGKYDSSRLVAGNRVTSKADIDGISFVAGNEVYLEGSSTYGFYAGNVVSIKGNIAKDLFVAGNSITLENDAIIGRDAFIAGNSVKITTNIGRDLRVAASLVDLSGITINGDAKITAENIIMDNETVINGTLYYYEDTLVTGLDLAKVGSINKLDSVSVSHNYNFGDIAWLFLERIVAAIIVMLVMFHFIPKTKEKLDELNLQFGDICKVILIGLGVLVICPIVALIAAFTGVLTPLALIFIGLYVLGLYLAKLLVGYIIGRIIATKLFNKDSVYLELIIGILLVRLVVLIPYIGGLIYLLSLLYGLGLIFKFIKNR